MRVETLLPFLTRRLQWQVGSAEQLSKNCQFQRWLVTRVRALLCWRSSNLTGGAAAPDDMFAELLHWTLMRFKSRFVGMFASRWQC